MSLIIPPFKEMREADMDQVPQSFDIIQPKFDGIFAHLVVRNGQGEVFSKTGKSKAVVDTRMPDGIYIGEYIRYSAWSATKSFYGKVVIFDAIEIEGEDLSALGYLRRVGLISYIPGDTGALKLQSYQRSRTDELWDKLVATHQYEGLVFRDSQANLDAHLIKCKLQLEETFYVTECYEGKGRNAGKLGAFGIARKPGGHEVARVGSGLNLQQATEFWALRDQLPGTAIEVKSYLGFGGEAPRQPVFLRLKL